MKKIGVKNHRSNKNKFRRSYKAVQTITVGEPGPSKAIIYDKDGKVVKFIKWTEKKQAAYTTKVATNTREENESIKKSKKELIKNILIKAGYDPTIKYTRKEKKRFTRIVKNNLFTKPKLVTLTDEQIKEKIKAEKLARKAIQDDFNDKVHNNPLPPKKGKQRAPSAAELSVKEKPNKRVFDYTIDRKCANELMRSYAFAKGTIEATTKENAFLKAKKIAKNYKSDTSFVGITIKDINGDNSIIFHTAKQLLAA